MIRLKRITFNNHPILGNLELDFTIQDRLVDTIIIAGENGTGKSTILREIQNLTQNNCQYIKNFVIDIDGQEEQIRVENNNGAIYYVFNNNQRIYSYAPELKKKLPFCSIYSDVAINYNVNAIRATTNKDVNQNKNSKHSNEQIANEIAQLLVDIDTLDNSDFRKEYENCKKQNKDTNGISIGNLRLERFKRAFNYMFDSLEWSGIKNEQEGKVIYFKNNNIEIPLNNLSSGEKQIVFRGSFLLQDKDSLNGAFVLLDEPEISLHPLWQKKILNFYKNIFTDSNNNQTSQIFVVTHSPFIIHSNQRYNDKVLVLDKNKNGEILVIDKPSYYQIGDKEAIQDAFSIYDFANEQEPTVYVEGETDELYLKEVIETFDLNVNFRIKWIGTRVDQGKIIDTGCSGLDKALNVLSKLDFKNMLLYDCDAKKEVKRQGQVYIKSLKQYNNQTNITVGIENALILDGIDIKGFYRETEKTDGTGAKIVKQELAKKELCNYICGLPAQQKKQIFQNLLDEMNEIVKLMN